MTMDYNSFKSNVLSIGLGAWILAWIVLTISLENKILLLGLIFYGLGISGITIHIALKAVEFYMKKRRPD